MATGAQRDEPSSRFCEIVQIGRLQGGQYGPHEITIFFKNTARGGKCSDLFSGVFAIIQRANSVVFPVTLLEFEVQGGIIVDEKGSRNRRTLKIVTTKGQNLGIARDPGGSKPIETIKRT